MRSHKLLIKLSYIGSVFIEIFDVKVLYSINSMAYNQGNTVYLEIYTIFFLLFCNILVALIRRNKFHFIIGRPKLATKKFNLFF